MLENSIHFIEADETIKMRVRKEWGEKAARHMHLADGFSIVALHREMLVGLIFTYWRELPAPLQGEFDAFIDILEVHKDFRRQGIARRLIEMSISKRRGDKRILRRENSMTNFAFACGQSIIPQPS